MARDLKKSVCVTSLQSFFLIREVIVLLHPGFTKSPCFFKDCVKSRKSSGEFKTILLYFTYINVSIYSIRLEPLCLPIKQLWVAILVLSFAENNNFFSQNSISM